MTTSSRWDFLGIAAAGSTLAAGGVFSGEHAASPADMSQGGGGRYVLPVKFGLGGVPLGNEFDLLATVSRRLHLCSGLAGGVSAPANDGPPWLMPCA
jgi:hypothetical protein